MPDDDELPWQESGPFCPHWGDPGDCDECRQDAERERLMAPCPQCHDIKGTLGALCNQCQREFGELQRQANDDSLEYDRRGLDPRPELPR